MRVQATNALGAAGVVSTRRQAAGGAFSVAEPEISRAPAQSSAPRSVASLDLLMALQGVDDPAERRRRSIRHGRTALDALDALKVGLIAGDLDRAALARLNAIAESLDAPSGDSRLDTILAEIALRAAVELAKFSQR